MSKMIPAHQSRTRHNRYFNSLWTWVCPRLWWVMNSISSDSSWQVSERKTGGFFCGPTTAGHL